MDSKDKYSAVNSGAVLRQQAEARVKARMAQLPEKYEELSPESTRQMLYELQVHQIELEMQNDELRQSQFALDSARARYFDLYDMAPVGYCTVSEPGLIRQANLTLATALGRTRSALVKQAFSRFVYGDDADRYYLHRKQLVESGEPQPCELRMLKPDGTTFWALLALIYAQDEDVPELRIAITDISARKKLEFERAQLDQALSDKNVELERAKTVAEKANLAKSDFLSGMSHELRTPLGAILGFAQLLESGTPQLTPTQRRGIEEILKAGWYLLELINEILDLAVIESGKLPLSLEVVSVAEVMCECEALIELQAQQHEICVTFPQFAIPYSVKADRTRLKQILVNLLSNAIKYNRTGGTVVVECSPSATDSLRITVRDSGAGMMPEQLEQLFQPFNRLGQEARTEQGTGIGLVVCKRLVELLGGVIGVESTVGTGSVFWIELKLLNTHQADAVLDTTDCGRLEQASTQTRTLLYVEDNPANLMLVEEIILRRPDMRLLTACDGSRGIELAREVLPEVILMDINLPGINGFQAMKVLAEDPATAAIPVIALSANAMSQDIENGLAAGFFRYLTKPIMVNEFLETLDLALEFRKKIKVSIH